MSTERIIAELSQFEKSLRLGETREGAAARVGVPLATLDHWQACIARAEQRLAHREWEREQAAAAQERRSTRRAPAHPFPRTAHGMTPL